FPASSSTLVLVNGCLDTNAPGFDGQSYQPSWPDGNTNLHPTPVLFTAPHTGDNWDKEYKNMAFETDTPRIEAPDLGGSCDTSTGTGCTVVPPTDEGQPATFYPFFSTTAGGENCQWLIGNDVPGTTVNDYGQTAQYGTLYPQHYLEF